MRYALALLLAAPAAWAQDIAIEDAYARSSNPRVGAAFMTIVNTGDAPDRLMAAETGAAAKVELHAHREVDGVMRMRPVEGGIAVPAGGAAHLERGGDHVMMMGLTAPLSDGDSVDLILRFETAGEIAITVPVDNTRQPRATFDH